MSRIPRPLPSVPTSPSPSRTPNQAAQPSLSPISLGSPIYISLSPSTKSQSSSTTSPTPTNRKPKYSVSGPARSSDCSDGLNEPSELPYRSPLRQFGRLGLGNGVQSKSTASPLSTPTRTLPSHSKSNPNQRPSIDSLASETSSDTPQPSPTPKTKPQGKISPQGAGTRSGNGAKTLPSVGKGPSNGQAGGGKLKKQNPEIILSPTRPHPTSSVKTKLYHSQIAASKPPTKSLPPNPSTSKPMKIRKSSISYPSSSPSYRLNVTLPSSSPSDLATSLGLLPSTSSSSTTARSPSLGTAERPKSVLAISVSPTLSPIPEQEQPTKRMGLLGLLSRLVGRGMEEVGGVVGVEAQGLGLGGEGGMGSREPRKKSEEVEAPRQLGKPFGEKKEDGGPAFGLPLLSIPTQAFCTSLIGGKRHDLPLVIFNTVEEIFARGMSQPGLFRLSGDPIRISHLYARYNTPPLYGDDLDLSQEPIHNLTGIVKRFVRDLPAPVLEVGLGDAFEWVCSDFARSEQVENTEEPGSETMTSKRTSLLNPDSRQILAAQILLRLLPPLQFSLLIYLLAFLGQLPLFSENKLSVDAIGSIFGPALCGARGRGVPGLGSGGKNDGGRSPSLEEMMSDGFSLDDKQRETERIVDKSQRLLSWLVKHWAEISENLLEMDVEGPPSGDEHAKSSSDGEQGRDLVDSETSRRQSQSTFVPALRLNHRHSMGSIKPASQADDAGGQSTRYDNPSLTSLLLGNRPTTTKANDQNGDQPKGLGIPMIKEPTGISNISEGADLVDPSALGVPMLQEPSGMSGPSAYSDDSLLPVTPTESVTRQLSADSVKRAPSTRIPAPTVILVPGPQPRLRNPTARKQKPLKRSRSTASLRESISSLKGLFLGRRGSEADLSGRERSIVGGEGIDEMGRMILDRGMLPEKSRGSPAQWPVALDLAAHEPSRQASAVLGSLHDLLTSKDAQIKRDRTEIDGLKKRLNEVEAIVETARKENDEAAKKEKVNSELERKGAQHPHRRSLSQTLGLSQTAQQTQIQIQALQAQISRLRTDLHAARMEHGRKDQRVETLEGELVAVRTLGDQKDVRIDMLQARVRDCERGKKKAEDGLAREKAKATALELERDAARKKLEEIRGALGV